MLATDPDGNTEWVLPAHVEAFEAGGAAAIKEGAQQPVTSNDVTLVIESETGGADALQAALKRAEEAEARANDLEKELAAAKAGGCCVLS